MVYQRERIGPMKDQQDSRLLELMMGMFVFIIAALIITAMCQPDKLQAQGYGTPLKQKYERRDIQNEIVVDQCSVSTL